MAQENLDFRPALVAGVYQAQVTCPNCGKGILTTNLEAFKNEDGIRCAEATDLICDNKDGQNNPCGNQIPSVLFNNWPYSAPMKWRK